MKGQIAVENLVIYLIASFLIISVLIALFSLDVFSPEKRININCSFVPSSPFFCVSYTYNETGGKLFIKNSLHDLEKTEYRIFFDYDNDKNFEEVFIPNETWKSSETLEINTIGKRKFSFCIDYFNKTKGEWEYTCGAVGKIPEKNIKMNVEIEQEVE